MRFQQHHILIERPGEETDGLGRQVSSGPAETIYDGNAEVQEQPVQKTTAQGNSVKVGEAQGWLPEGESITALGIQQGDQVMVTRPDGSTFEGAVATTRPVDDRFVLSKDRSD